MRGRPPEGRVCLAATSTFPEAPLARPFETRNDALYWMIDNQFGRRNLPQAVRVELALKIEEVIAAQAKERQGTRTDLTKPPDKENIPHNCAECSPAAPTETRDVVASKAGVSHETVRRTKYVKAHGSKKLYQKLLRGEVSLNEAYTKLKKDEKKAAQQKAAAEIRRDTSTNVG